MSRLALSWSGPDGAVLHELGTAESVIGRAEECEVVLADRSVSRRHARVAPEADGWWIEDLGSRGGTWVNGRPISRPTRLAPGDRVGVGQSVLAVVDAGHARQSAASGPLAPGTSLFRRADELQTGDVEVAQRRGE